MTKINFATLEPFMKARQVLFIKPLMCKTVRVFGVPENFLDTGQYEDIVEVLDATSSLKRGNIWYYTPSDTDMLYEAMWFLTEHIAAEYFLVEEQPKFGRDDNNNPIQSVLN